MGTVSDKIQTTELLIDTSVRGNLPAPHGPADPTASLLAAIWAAMMEIENGYPATAYETLQHAWESHRG